MMARSEAIRIAAKGLSTRNWITFAEIESETGFTRDQILEIKRDIEATLRRDDPSVRVISRVDLDPEGFEASE